MNNFDFTAYSEDNANSLWDSKGLSYIRTGVLFLKPYQPYYMVDLYPVNETLNFIACYNIEPTSLKQYQKEDQRTGKYNPALLKKDFDIVVIDKDSHNPFSKKRTKAEKLAYANTDTDRPEVTYKNLIKKPVFVSVIQEGKDSIYNNDDVTLGFYEYEPKSSHIDIAKQTTSLTQNPTGVFLSLDRISWLETKLPTEGLKSTLTGQTDNLINQLMMLDSDFYG